MDMAEVKHAIVLFDGVCNFCDSSVQFIIKRDPDGYYQFANLQSEYGRALLRKYKLPEDKLDSIILWEQGKLYRKSSAALRIAINLTGLWPFAGFLLLIPSFIRNFFYDLIAGNRYRIFGKKDACTIPSPEIRERFLS